MYSFKGRSKKKTSIAKEMKENQYIFTLIDDALESLKLNDLEKTAIIYTEIELIYNNLAKDKKDEIYPRIVDLCNEINLHYISVLVSKSDELISENKMPEANQVYREIQEIYNLLDDKHREMVHEKCIEIHDSLYKNTNAEQVV